MKALVLILMILAVLLLLLAVEKPSLRGYNLLALGLAVWAFAELLRGV